MYFILRLLFYLIESFAFNLTTDESLQIDIDNEENFHPKQYVGIYVLFIIGAEDDRRPTLSASKICLFGF
jgi:hypothetical protein